MTDRPFYCVPDGGRTTVLKRIASSRPVAVVTGLSEESALALATSLNDLTASVDECCATIRRERGRVAELVKYLRMMVDLCGPAHDADGLIPFAKLFDKNYREAVELLAVYDAAETPTPFPGVPKRDG